MSESNDTKSFRIDYRHMTFFFLGAVCVCAVFFALGFVVGRAQAFETALKDEDPKNLVEGTMSSPPAPGDPVPVATREEPPAVNAAGGKTENANQGAARCRLPKGSGFLQCGKGATGRTELSSGIPKSG